MRNRWIGASVTLTAALALTIGGCGPRDNPVEPDSPVFGRSLEQPLGFKQSLEDNPLQDPFTRIVRTYTPPTYQGQNIGPKFPVLYLLHGFGGDGDYFEEYNLTTLLDEMINEGPPGGIDPIIVVTVDASNFFGGSYYTNSVTSGNYADLLLDLIDLTERNYNTVERIGFGARGRAIGGHGMGGYGAFRTAMANPNMFSSVSSISGPLSLGGADGQSGLMTWFDKVLEENGLTPPVDEVDFRDMLRPGDGKPFSNRLFAMAAAFSGRPIRVEEVGECTTIDTTGSTIDTTCAIVDLIGSQINTTCFIDTVESEQEMLFEIRINDQVVDSVTITDTLRTIVQICLVDTFTITGEGAVVPPDPCDVDPIAPFEQELCFAHTATVEFDGMQYQVDTTVCKDVTVEPAFEFCDADTILKEIEECTIDTTYDVETTVFACTTFVDNMRPTSVPLNVRNDTLVVDLPFDVNGDVVDSVWSRWLANDVQSIYQASPSSLGNLAIYFEAGADDEYGMQDMSAAFHDALGNATHSYREFESFDGVKAGHYELVFKRLREIVKFHADRLDQQQ